MPNVLCYCCCCQCFTLLWEAAISQGSKSLNKVVQLTGLLVTDLHLPSLEHVIIVVTRDDYLYYQLSDLRNWKYGSSALNIYIVNMHMKASWTPDLVFLYLQPHPIAMFRFHDKPWFIMMRMGHDEPGACAVFSPLIS